MIRVILDEFTDRWLEVRDVHGWLITVLDLLSPSHKIDSDGRDRRGRTSRAADGFTADRTLWAGI